MVLCKYYVLTMIYVLYCISSTSPVGPPSLYTTMEVLRQRRDRIDRERERIDRERERLREEEMVRREEEEEEERQLQEALQVSQQQFDEDSRLKAGTVIMSVVISIYHFSQILNWLCY